MPPEAKTPEPSLHWQDENGVPRRLPLTDKVFLGRICRGIEQTKCILVPNPSVSRDHAVIRLTRDGVAITDMSKNGTWINTVRMAPGATRQLEDGDLITLGRTSIRLSCPNLAPVRQDEEQWMEQTAIRPANVRITSLVADVRGFTAFSQQVASTTVYAFIKEVFTRFSGIVNEHQGTVKDYAGDAVFAFWEHPGEFSSDHALLACQAAIAQLRCVPQIHRQLVEQGLEIPPPKLGWGMSTGQVTLSHYGSRSGGMALVGDCINLAFRLSSMAEKILPAPIAMCRQTASLVSPQLSLVDLQTQEIRGRTGQEHLFGLCPT